MPDDVQCLGSKARVKGVEVSGPKLRVCGSGMLVGEALYSRSRKYVSRLWDKCLLSLAVAHRVCTCTFEYLMFAYVPLVDT